MNTTTHARGVAAPRLRHATARAANDPLARLDWAALQELTRSAPVAAGYSLALLERAQVCDVIALIADWFPDICVGSASGYLDESFYRRQRALCRRAGTRRGGGDAAP